MKSSLRFAATFAFALAALTARAQLTLNFDFIAFRNADGTGYYYVSPSLTASNGQVPVTSHHVQSFSNNLSADVFTNSSSSTGFGSSDLPEVVFAITNGSWKLILNVGATNAQTNLFRLSASLTTNTLGPMKILSPTNGAVLASNNPPYFWQAPTNWDRIWVFLGDDCVTYNNGFASLATNLTNWTTAPALPAGNTTFTLNLGINGTPWFSTTTPTNALGQPVTNWHLTVAASEQIQSRLTVTPTAFPFLWAHYKFDDTNDLYLDSSCQGNRLAYSYNSVDFTNTGVAGGAVVLNSSGFGLPDVLRDKLWGDFSVSMWVKTRQTNGNDADPAFAGGLLVTGDAPGTANDSVPLALTGSKAAFMTGGATDDTLHSSSNINSGAFTHLVVTRERASGIKRIYVNGVLDAAGLGTTNLLVNTANLVLGDNGFVGIVDDVQVYQGVLAPDQVAALFAFPGLPAPPSNPLAGLVGLKAHYTFDNTNDYGEDISGQNNYVAGGSWCAGTGPVFTNAGLAGSAAVFSGTNWLDLNSNVAAACSADFSVSLWVKTTGTFGADTDPAGSGAGLLSAENYSAPFFTVIPLALTGSKLACMTSDSNYADVTVNSAQSINTGSFVHVVATREQASGIMRLYVNGAPGGTAVGPTNLQNDFNRLALGHRGDCSSGVASLIDEVQIYTGVLTPAQVSYMFNHPTETAPLGPISIAEAVDATNLVWNTGGDASWTGQATTTHDSSDAAQSGIITNLQSTYIETTVNGPGLIAFWWKIATTNNDYLEFDISGLSQNYIDGNTDWNFQSFTVFGSGPQTLRWTFFADGSVAGNTNRGWVDQVVFTHTAVPPTITRQPSNSVTLAGTAAGFLSAATGEAPLTFQWQLNGSPVSGKTNAVLIFTNVAASNAGNYTLLVTNAGGAATSSVATLTVTNIPGAPPFDWATAASGAAGSVSEQIVADRSNHLYLAGNFTGTNSLGTNVIVATNGTKLFIAKFDGDGRVLWTRVAGATNTFCNAINVAPDGRLLVAGSYQGTAGFGAFTLTNAGGYDAFVAAYDPNGGATFAQRWGGTNGEYAQGVDADTNGFVYATGVFRTAATVGASNVTGTNISDALLVKLATNGAVLWIVQPGGGLVQGFDVAVQSNAIYWTGVHLGTTMTLGTNTLGTNGGKTFLARLDTNGNPAWLRTAGSDDTNSYPFLDFLGLAKYSGGGVYLGGRVVGTNATFGTNVIAGAPGLNTILSRWDTNGVVQMARLVGTTNLAAFAVASDPAGNVVIGGSWRNGPVDLGGLTLFNGLGPGYDANDVGAFAAKYSPAGALLWARGTEATNFAGAANDPGVGLVLVDIAAGLDGQVFLAGTLTNTVLFGTNAAAAGLAPNAAFVTKLDTGSSPVPWTLVTNQGVTNFVFNFRSTVGRTHAVEYRDDLRTGSWLTLTNVNGDGSVMQFVQPAAGLSKRFFHVRTY